MTPRATTGRRAVGLAALVALAAFAAAPAAVKKGAGPPKKALAVPPKGPAGKTAPGGAVPAVGAGVTTPEVVVPGDRDGDGWDEGSADAGVAKARLRRNRGADAPTSTAMAPVAGAHAVDTRCGACHAPSGWRQVRFNHEPTGFPLKGLHARTPCKACHALDFKASLPRQCVGCHDDPHTGDMGARCDGCHDETGWRTSVGVEAHRRSGFPLVGAHGAVPCLECHPDAREKRFSRPAVACAGCHEADRSATSGGPVDHAQLRFSGACNDCHGEARFSPARFPDHDRCFLLSAGSHAALGCTQCHTGPLSGAAVGSCSTNNAACTTCHEHECTGPGGSSETDRKHAAVLGYQCRDRKCFECHQGGAP